MKAKLTWSLVARDIPFKPEGLDEFAFCNGTEDFRLNRALDRISQFNAQGELTDEPTAKFIGDLLVAIQNLKKRVG